jgi:hypothetical protein
LKDTPHAEDLSKLEIFFPTIAAPASGDGPDARIPP